MTPKQVKRAAELLEQIEQRKQKREIFIKSIQSATKISLNNDEKYFYVNGEGEMIALRKHLDNFFNDVIEELIAEAKILGVKVEGL